MTNRGENLSEAYESLYRSYASLRREVDHLSTLREIGLAISSSLELEETLEVIAHVVVDALEVRRLTIFELDRDAGLLRPVIAKYGRDLITKERLAEETVHVYGSPLGDALEGRQPVLVNTDYQSAAFVPLVARDESIGVMRLEERKDGLPFDQNDLELFQSLGPQIAIALHNAQLYALAVTDGLTRLFVRRYFDLRMEEQFDQAIRYERPFSLLMFDIDHFKKFNDTHGHQVGDMVLRQFARLLEDNTRKSDLCCRYGGEEMAVIAPESSLEEAAMLANKLCATIRDNIFIGAGGKELSVTASIGVSSYCDQYDTPGQMLKAADAALYRAKELGRNRVELADL